MNDDDIAAAFSIDHVDDDLLPYLFLRGHTARGDVHLLRRLLKRTVPREVLPERARVLRSVDAGTSYDVLAEVDGVLVLLRSWNADGDVWASSGEAAAARAVVAEIESRMPSQPDPRRIGVTFTDEQTGGRHLDLDVRPWPEISQNYAPEVKHALDILMAHTPQWDEARRLLLWHGEPGTGKTTAIRALLHAWKGWADGTVVTDPEALLSSGKYLRRALLDAEDDGRWQLFILEDAESLLHKGSGAKGMAKLLNLADGLLGQGLRCLFLITTNEPLGTVHPALVRPGRCLARVEFTALPQDQASRLLRRPVAGSMTLAELLASRPVSSLAQDASVGQYL